MLLQIFRVRVREREREREGGRERTNVFFIKKQMILLKKPPITI
jgi:hypothetical protein